jgi:hypothetical protein
MCRLLFAPRGQGVVDRQLLRQLLLVVLVRETEPLGDRRQPARLWREIVLVGVSAANDERQPFERRLLLRKFAALDDRVEGTRIAVVPELHAGNVICRRALAFRDERDLVARDVQEIGISVDEALDQPRSGNPIDLRPFTSGPSGRSAHSDDLWPGPG